MGDAVVQLNCRTTWHTVVYKAVAQGLRMRYVSACESQDLVNSHPHELVEPTCF